MAVLGLVCTYVKMAMIEFSTLSSANSHVEIIREKMETKDCDNIASVTLTFVLPLNCLALKLIAF